MSEPLPEYNNPKELYAFFGLAFYKAQVLEQGLLNLTVALHLADCPNVDLASINHMFGKWGSETLGRILNVARDLIEFPVELENRLQTALKYRNHLAHSFFVDHDLDLLSDAGRCQMIDELTKIYEFLDSVDKELDPIWMAAWEKIGMTEESYINALEEMKRNACVEE